MKSEFKSPTPSQRALNFAHDAAAEIATFLRVVTHLGCGAPALSATGNGGGSLHVHVNVRSPIAGGSPLSVEEILHVYISWVRFDSVTARCARPWCWREPSMAPLYASGTEFLYREKAWEQGGGNATASHERLATYDIPKFVAAVRALLHAPGWSEYSEDEQLERLFGRADATPASQIGRYCSLNLRRLTTYGTLEIRRFHSCIDPAIVCRWAHLCVSFVEAFRGGGDGLAPRVLSAGVPLDTALSELRAAQEAATPAELMAAMEGFVDPRTARVLMRDSGAERYQSTRVDASERRRRIKAATASRAEWLEKQRGNLWASQVAARESARAGAERREEAEAKERRARLQAWKQARGQLREEVPGLTWRSVQSIVDAEEIGHRSPPGGVRSTSRSPLSRRSPSQSQ